MFETVSFLSSRSWEKVIGNLETTVCCCSQHTQCQNSWSSDIWWLENQKPCYSVKLPLWKQTPIRKENVRYRTLVPRPVASASPGDWPKCRTADSTRHADSERPMIWVVVRTWDWYETFPSSLRKELRMNYAYWNFKASFFPVVLKSQGNGSLWDQGRRH